MLSNKKLFLACAALGLSQIINSAALESGNIVILNKLNQPIAFDINTRQHPPLIKDMEPIKPGMEVRRTYGYLGDTPQLLIGEVGKKDMAVLYEFPNNAKKIEIRIVPDKGSYKLEPQTTAGFARSGNVKQSDIKLVGTRGSMAAQPAQNKKPMPQPAPSPAAAITEYDILGLRKGATDAEILGLNADEIKDKTAVKKAYFKLSRTWHPDKIKDNETAKKAYATYQNEINKLDKQDQQNLPGGVFSLIQGAYERNR